MPNSAHFFWAKVGTVTPALTRVPAPVHDRRPQGGLPLPRKARLCAT